MKKMMVVALMMVVMVVNIGVGMGNLGNSVVYKVGDSAGWTNVANVDYKAWASSKQFHVGDVIVFEYNKEFHNVARVDHKSFQSCNLDAAPRATYATGNDSITLKKNTHYYFICTVPGHCQNGQKLDIRVTPNSINLAPHYGPGPVEPLPFPFPPSPTASSPPSISPVPSPSQASPPSQPPSTPQVPPSPSSPPSISPVPSPSQAVPPSQPPFTPPQVPSPSTQPPSTPPQAASPSSQPPSTPPQAVPPPVPVAPVPSSVPDVPEADAPAPSPSGSNGVFAGKFWMTVVVVAACVYGGMA